MSEARKAGATLESIKVIPFSGTDTTKGGMEPREFFMKAEVFAATKGFKRALLEDRVSPSMAIKAERTDEEEELIRQDDEAKHFLIMSCRGDAFAIIESHETAFAMYQALKDRYDSKKTRDLVKATCSSCCLWCGPSRWHELRSQFAARCCDPRCYDLLCKMPTALG